MHVTIDDAAAIYARACRAWYGKRAMRIVKDRARQLAKRGDAKGVAAWTKSRSTLSALERSPEKATHAFAFSASRTHGMKTSRRAAHRK
jgi:hypothetical protein